MSDRKRPCESSPEEEAGAKRIACADEMNDALSVIRDAAATGTIENDSRLFDALQTLQKFDQSFNFAGVLPLLVGILGYCSKQTAACVYETLAILSEEKENQLLMVSADFGLLPFLINVLSDKADNKDAFTATVEIFLKLTRQKSNGPMLVSSDCELQYPLVRIIESEVGVVQINALKAFQNLAHNCEARKEIAQSRDGYFVRLLKTLERILSTKVDDSVVFYAAGILWNLSLCHEKAGDNEILEKIIPYFISPDEVNLLPLLVKIAQDKRFDESIRRNCLGVFLSISCIPGQFLSLLDNTRVLFPLVHPKHGILSILEDVLKDGYDANYVLIRKIAPDPCIDMACKILWACAEHATTMIASLITTSGIYSDLFSILEASGVDPKGWYVGCPAGNILCFYMNLVSVEPNRDVIDFMKTPELICFLEELLGKTTEISIERLKATIILLFMTGRDKDVLLTEGTYTLLLTVFENTISEKREEETGYAVGTFCIKLLLRVFCEYSKNPNNRAILLESETHSHQLLDLLKKNLRRFELGMPFIRACGGGARDNVSTSKTIYLIGLFFGEELKDKYLPGNMDIDKLLIDCLSCRDRLQNEDAESLSHIIRRVHSGMKKINFPLPDASHYHVFITHDWGLDQYNRDNHETMTKVNEALKAKGIITWFDKDRLTGNIVQKLSDGIEQSACVLVAVTKNYIAKVGGTNDRDYCKLEFGYASRSKGGCKMIPLPIEEICKDPKKWTGPVGITLGGEVFPADFAFDADIKSDMSRFQVAIDKIAECIRSKISAP